MWASQAPARDWSIRLRRSGGTAEVKGHDVIELIIARADTPVRHEVALDGIGHVPRWMYGSSPSATTNGGLDVVLSDAGVDHARQVAGAIRARWRRSVPAECAVECQGDQRDERANDHQIARYGSAARPNLIKRSLAKFTRQREKPSAISKYCRRVRDRRRAGAGSAEPA